MRGVLVAWLLVAGCGEGQAGVPGSGGGAGASSTSSYVGGGGAGTTTPSTSAPGGGGSAPWQPVETDWCQGGWLGLDEATCFYAPGAPAPTEVLVFLHGMMPPDASPKGMQDIVAGVAEERGAVALFPRGQQGLCAWDSSVLDWWCWPTSRAAVDEQAAAMTQGWSEAVTAVEGILEVKLVRRYVLGFSNGGYFASYVGLEGWWAVDGAGLVAAGRSFVDTSLFSEARPGFYIGVGELDAQEVKDSAQNLAYVLSLEGWPHVYSLAPNKGHELWPSDLEAAWKLWAPP